MTAVPESGAVHGRHWGFLIGAGLLGVAAFVAVFAPLIAPHDPFQQDLALRLKPPFWHDGAEPGYLLGTDQLGRDYLSRLIHGTRISLALGLGAVVISGLIGYLVLGRGDLLFYTVLASLIVAQLAEYVLQLTIMRLES